MRVIKKKLSHNFNIHLKKILNKKKGKPLWQPF